MRFTKVLEKSGIFAGIRLVLEAFVRDKNTSQLKCNLLLSSYLPKKNGNHNHKNNPECHDRI